MPAGGWLGLGGGRMGVSFFGGAEKEGSGGWLGGFGGEVGSLAFFFWGGASFEGTSLPEFWDVMLLVRPFWRHGETVWTLIGQSTQSEATHPSCGFPNLKRMLCASPVAVGSWLGGGGANAVQCGFVSKSGTHCLLVGFSSLQRDMGL